MKKALLILCAMVMFAPSDSQVLLAQPLARVDSFYMPSLGRTKKISILLPAGYSPRHHYAVLYLLHGFGGDNTDWLARTKLKEYVTGMPLIVVMPDAGNSWYVNSATERSDRYEDYIARDVPAYVQKMYSVDTTREAIAGLSMGGYGALMLGMRHPERYEFAGSLSGAITFPRGMNDTTREVERPLFPSLRRAFGENGGDAKNGYDLFTLYKQVPKSSMPYLYLAAGIQDGYRTFLPAHRVFTDLLRAYGAAYEYHEVPGGHNWQFWDREIQYMLKRMREVMKF